MTLAVSEGRDSGEWSDSRGAQFGRVPQILLVDQSSHDKTIIQALFSDPEIDGEFEVLYSSLVRLKIRYSGFPIVRLLSSVLTSSQRGGMFL